MSDLRVRFTFAGHEHSLTVNEAGDLMARIREARDALKVKCPTCRCRLFPGSTCSCCADDGPAVPTREPTGRIERRVPPSAAPEAAGQDGGGR